jgi:hypothetical protein
MDMPLNFVFKAPIGKKAKFMFGAGPYISFFYNGTENLIRSITTVISRAMKTATYP